MDIVAIGSSQGNEVDFMSLVDSSMKEKCLKYQTKCRGPYKVLRNDAKKTAVQFLEEAFKPLEQYKDKIGVVIDGSTTRGFTEPSTASLYAQHLGIDGPVCFDVTEACNGWARAVETAYMMFQTNPNYEDKYILITNNEHPPMTRPMLPKDPSDYRQVASYYVGLTFSWACTCTLLKKSDNYSWQFIHHSDPVYASHISIPLPQIAKGFTPKSDVYEILLNEEYGQFCIPRLHQQEKKIQFVLGTVDQNEEFYAKTNVICHTWTKYVYEEFFKNHKLGELSLYFGEIGNVGSCSMPLILHDQYKNNIPKGQHLCFCGSAAGGSDIMLNFVHGIETEKKLQKKEKKSNLYVIYARVAWRRLLTKLGCSRRQNKVKVQADTKTQ
ncbi:Thiolase-like protein [Pseudocohnilembus persalinus]|uniref:Thiolase-like protein n=1 Tax=Pseudocohnilembus persalinus TaxID=266149 RepID=A0A0V0Q813_PSEPJ|nr:Thiolase-like protein [Pseudocohnilembus persalinus]|eukprot:KRW98364.1 Thiolase-like protein [Pseudocohnilembus persalinus]